MTIFWHWTGPLLRYESGVLTIEDLNPEIKTRWRLTRWELIKIGVRCVLAALKSRSVDSART